MHTHTRPSLSSFCKVLKIKELVPTKAWERITEGIGDQRMPCSQFPLSSMLIKIEVNEELWKSRPDLKDQENLQITLATFRTQRQTKITICH